MKFDREKGVITTQGMESRAIGLSGELDFPVDNVSGLLHRVVEARQGRLGRDFSEHPSGPRRQSAITENQRALRVLGLMESEIADIAGEVLVSQTLEEFGISPEPKHDEG